MTNARELRFVPRLFSRGLVDARFLKQPRSHFTRFTMTDVERMGKDCAVKFLSANPIVDGIFMDNLVGKAPVGNAKLIEDMATTAVRGRKSFEHEDT